MDREAVRARRLHRLMRRNWTRRLVSIFLIWHIAALTLWLLPADHSSALAQALLPSVRPYLTWTGLAQNWNMFAPNPADLDVSVEAHIQYADGRQSVWQFPRPADMGYAERYRRERFYKYIENAHGAGSKALWPYLARYVARCNNFNPQVPPTSITLVRRFRLIPPPGMPLPPFKTEAFYTTRISAGDL